MFGFKIVSKERLAKMNEELIIAKEKYRTLLRENKGSKFSIFILSENEGDNLVELDRLLRSEFVESHRLNISFYCQAHKDAKNVSFVRDGKSNTEITYVDLVDISLLAIFSGSSASAFLIRSLISFCSLRYSSSVLLPAI